MALFENLRSLFSPNVAYVYGGGMDLGVRVADMDAAQLYRTQPNLRAAVTFLADNAAQVPLKVHARAADDDRPRVLDSPLALLLECPNADMTPFEFRRWLYSDLLLYERFLMIVVPSAETPSGWEVRPVPNSWIRQYKGSSPFAPESVVVGTGKSTAVEIPAGKFVLWHGYDPNDPMRQCSRIGALKETLHEQVESNRFRRQMWRRGGRFNAYLTRPASIEPWSDAAFDRFKETWRASWAGSDAGEGGGMPILEDGMEIKTVQFNSRDAQWCESVKLAREDVAAVYHFNPALLWPGSGQTYASARDNARALYNDCLAPTLMFATDRMNHTLAKMVGEPPEDYVNYDITIKTEGSFEEKVSALQSAVGAPFLTRDEARAKLNLPAIGADQLIVPLNVLEGGLASNHDTDPTVERYNSLAAMLDEADRILGRKSGEAMRGPKAAVPEARMAKGDPSDGDADELTGVYRAFFERQAKSVIPKIEAGREDWWDARRWDRELADDLYPVAIKQADAAGERIVSELWPDDPTRKYGKRQTAKYSRRTCEVRAGVINAATRDELEAAIESDGKAKAEKRPLMSAVRTVFDYAAKHRAVTAGGAFAAGLLGFAMHEAWQQNRRVGENVYKTWRTTSGTPRASHKAMNGQTVQMDLPFSNGMMYPGDWANGSAAECAHCKCVLDVEVRERSRLDAVRAVVDELEIDGDYSEACVYDAYIACADTVGVEATEAEVFAEMRTRDIDWIKNGTVHKPTYATQRVKEAVTVDNPWEGRTGERIARHGFKPDHIVDYEYYIAEDGIKRRRGLPDFANGVEIKTVRSSANPKGAVRNYYESVEKKSGVTRLIIDNSEAEIIKDSELLEAASSLVGEYKLPKVSVLYDEGKKLKNVN